MLSLDGLDPEAAEVYQRRGLLSGAECRRIDAMLIAYGNRAGVLGRASRHWFPPRVQHLCLVTNGLKTRPYFQPFHASSWLLYRDDLADERSSLEFTIFLLFQAERQYLQQQVGASLMSNLPYLLILNDEQLDDFLAGCRRSTRPDAAGYRALADAMPWIRELHNPLSKHPPQRRSSVLLPNGLSVTPDEHRRLETLHRQWMASVEDVMNAYRDSAGRPSAQAGRSLLDWLDREAPHLVLTGENAALLWTGPDSATDELREVLRRVGPEAEASILEDLKVVDRKSRVFLASLTAPDELARPAPWMTEGGLSFIHADTNRIAYSLTDGPERLRHPSPPYERLMLAARTIHEWGHQAAESGWVRVPPERAEVRARLERQLVEQLDAIVDRLPAGAGPGLVAAIRLGEREGMTPGERLLESLERRIDDYTANLVARHFLSPDEMDTYIRNNVGARLLEHAPEQALTHLLRLAYEYQYLALSRIADPWTWFMNSTWFHPLFIETGIIDEPGFERLTRTIGELCACFAIDVERIDVAAANR